MSSPTPRLIAGRYALTAQLGAGGMGTVWRARDEVLGREVAVKEVTFPAGIAEDEREVLRERTRREARAAARLDHPSAVTVYDVVEQDGSPYIVMELVEARTLADLTREQGPLSPQRTAHVGLALLGALEAAHAQGILHRDVKPANVLLRDDGRVVLTDFGIATGLGDSSLTHTGLLVGSPAYIAPERARGEQAGPPSDLWSLGATLFTAVEGRAPYDAGEPLLTVSAVVADQRAPYALAGPLVPVLDGLLAPDPGERLDVPAARRLLERVADDRPGRTQVLPVPAPPPIGELPVAPAPAARTAALRLDAVPPPEAAAPVPPPRPAAPPPAGRRTRWWVPAAVAVGMLAVGGGAIALALDDDPGTGPAALSSASPTPDAPSVQPSPQDEPSPAEPTEPAETEAPEPEPSPAAPTEPAETEPPEVEPTAAPEPGAEGLPEGWTTDTAPAGWTVTLPPGYEQRRAGEYRNPDRRTLRITTGTGRPDAVADRQAAAADFVQRHPTYAEIRIDPVDYRGAEAADWEFTYEGLHVINRVFVVDGTGHSLFFQYPEGDAGAAADFAAIAERFRPVGG